MRIQEKITGLSEGRAACLSLAVLLFAAGLAAGCGGVEQPSGQSSPPPAPAPAPGNPTCGIVSVRGPNPPTDPAALQSESCFFDAYTACKAAGLNVVNQGVDVTSTTTFSIRSASPCGIDATTETVFVPNGRQTSSFTCAQLTRQNGGLLFAGCGQAGNIFVPPPTP